LSRAAPASVADRVIRWQRAHGRHDLPWQGSRDPYRVWLSEVMLQQTQVATVLDYYRRFLDRFPGVEALAGAPLDDVLALWSGLGYYSRARNLHRCAQTVVLDHGGRFPGDSRGLAALPGIGRSTAAAIAAFCYGERAAILDGNVRRVLSRLLGFEGDLARAPEQARLWAAAEALLPEREVEVYTQGLMDLGATVCHRRQPDCGACPLAAGCVALALGRPQQFPVRSRRPARGRRSHALLWLERAGQILLVQRPPQGVWAGLWSLPEHDTVAALESCSRSWPGAGHWLPPIEHALTHFDWTLQVLHWQLPAAAELPPGLPGGRWQGLEAALALGLPAPIRKLFSR
jgi:A/G-specific adenine glycosylase